MEYVNDINLNEAVIHILDTNGQEPVLNEFSLDLDEDIYKFVLKHVEKAIKDDELKYAKFSPERSIVKETVQDYLNGVSSSLIELSKELASQLFNIMKSNVNIPSGDLIIVGITTDQGPMIGILKMDYVKNFTHAIQFVDEKIGIGITPQAAGLPGSGQKIQKAAFIKPIREGELFNIMVLDKQRSAKDEEYGANYFINTFLGATLVTNERDNTRGFMKASETWIRKNFPDNAEKAEEVRNTFRKALVEEDIINVEDLSDRVMDVDYAENFRVFMAANCEEEFSVDKVYAEKKTRRIKLDIDNKISLSIESDAYKDTSRFETVPNGDGSINIIIKNVISYTEK